MHRGPEREWIVPVLSAQWIMEYDLHVGATTSLHLSGHRLDLPLGGKKNVYVQASDMPTWIGRLDLRASLRLRTKRLFFVFADKHSHKWRKYFDPNDFDLGSGDRAFTENGRLHPVYRITVPRDFVPSGEEVSRGA